MHIVRKECLALRRRWVKARRTMVRFGCLSCLHSAGDVKFKSFAGYRCHAANHYNDLAVLVFNPQVGKRVVNLVPVSHLMNTRHICCSEGRQAETS